MNTLRLWIDSDFPERHAACHWWLYDQGGALLQQGCSEPRHWPGIPHDSATKSDDIPHCEVLLSADQATSIVTTLPSGKAAHAADIVRYAVEERLIEDVQSYHLVRGRSLAGERHEIIALSNRRIDIILASLLQVGLRPTRMVISAQALAVDDGSWPLLLTPNGGSLSTPNGWLNLDGTADDYQPPAELRWLIGSERASDCTALRLLTLGKSTISCAHWSSALDKPLSEGVPLDAAQVCRSGVNLLQGAYAPRREFTANWRTLLPVARLAAIALSIALISLVGEWLWLRQTHSSLKQDQVSVVKQALPTLPIIVSPMLQMQRGLDSARHAQGELSDSDFLPLLASLAEVLDGNIESLRYREARLEVKLVLPDSDSLERLKESLRERGIAMTISTSAPSATVLRALIVLGRGDLS